jgi:hypothetical protein
MIVICNYLKVDLFRPIFGEKCYYDTQIHTQIWYKGIFVILTPTNKGIIRYKWIVKYVCEFCVIKVCHNNITQNKNVFFTMSKHKLKLARH